MSLVDWAHRMHYGLVPRWPFVEDIGEILVASGGEGIEQMSSVEDIERLRAEVVF